MWPLLMLVFHEICFYKGLSVKIDCQRPYANDCQDVKAQGFTESGVYHMTPAGTYTGYDVYCDMDTDNGGWLVFQRREDGSADFYRDWEDYQFGFGDVSGEHWLGNFPLYTILLEGNFELRIDMQDWEGNSAYAKYETFGLTGPEGQYRITVDNYSGNAGDCLSQMSGMKFTTRDRDNDIKDKYNCAEKFTGAWWYTKCHCACLNGLYFRDNSSYANGVVWRWFKGYNYSLKKAEMKIRRI